MTGFRNRITRQAIDRHRVEGEWVEVWYITGQHGRIPLRLLEQYTA